LHVYMYMAVVIVVCGCRGWGWSRCCRLGLVSVALLWQRLQSRLLADMIHSQLHAVIIKVATIGEPVASSPPPPPR
jgi:hypothetical protein